LNLPSASSDDEVSKDSEKGSAGKLLIVAGPSGVGKSSIVHELLKKSGRKLSVSCTTRPPREGERDGVDYSFLGTEEFETLIGKNGFAEYAHVHGNYYGTMRRPLDEALSDGTVCILDIDVQGAEQIKAEYPEAISIFILPPSFEVLEARLRGRRTDDEAVIKGRLKRAKAEISRQDEFDHRVVNEQLEKAVSQIEVILKS
jgi:guanylate kinase